MTRHLSKKDAYVKLTFPLLSPAVHRICKTSKLLLCLDSYILRSFSCTPFYLFLLSSKGKYSPDRWQHLFSHSSSFCICSLLHRCERCHHLMTKKMFTGKPFHFFFHSSSVYAPYGYFWQGKGLVTGKLREMYGAVVLVVYIPTSCLFCSFSLPICRLPLKCIFYQ